MAGSAAAVVAAAVSVVGVAGSAAAVVAAGVGVAVVAGAGGGPPTLSSTTVAFLNGSAADADAAPLSGAAGTFE